jgi:isocitrate dehydrogenase
MSPFEKLEEPEDGSRIGVADGELKVPDDPVIPIIEGDGIGPDVTGAARKVLSAGVESAYGGSRRLVWLDIPAGEAAKAEYGELLPQDTFDAISYYRVALKGPLTTPIGGGFRSLNVTLRQTLDLYANVRPIYWIPGVPSPVKRPERMDIVVFREATEDVYAGIEWARGSLEAMKLRHYLKTELDVDVPEDAGIGLKPISEFKTKRLVRKAIRFALDRRKESVTIVHKGNIMKYTEGAFREWGYEVAADEFGGKTLTEQELWDSYDGQRPVGKVVIKDRLADNMLQQLLTRTDEYDVLALPNLNGDYVSDAAAGQVGGLGIAPGGNIGDETALFEPVHGSAPKYTGMNKVNPTAEILAGVMMLEHLGWEEAAKTVKDAVAKTVANKTVTYDLHRQMEGATKVSTSEFADLIIKSMETLGTAGPA